MKKILLLAFTFTSFISLFAQWNNTGMNTENTLKRCSFPSNDTGYIISDKIYRTVNGGTSFDSIFIGNAVNYYSIDFRTNLDGVIAVDVASSGNSIFRTLNGGNTWQNISVPPFQGIGINVKFADLLHGTYLTSAPIIYNTANGGITWDTMTYGYDYFNELDYPTATTGYIGGFDGTFNYYGVIAKTTNGGVTWNVVNNFTQNGSIINHMQFLNADTGFACFNPLSIPSRLLRTYNGAASWDTVYFNGFIEDFTFSDYQHGFIISDSGSIYITSNAGVSWTLDRLATDYLSDIAVTPSFAYAVGVSGTAIKRNLPAGIPVQQLETTLSIYPNPCADHLIVTLPHSTDVVSVTATDVTGKNCGDLSFTTLNANEISLDTRRLAKGFYILQINGKNESFKVKFEKGKEKSKLRKLALFNLCNLRNLWL
ncbi:MAG: T9SS type A sorting domain-containing protein [Bacteroidia bacterium]